MGAFRTQAHTVLFFLCIGALNVHVHPQLDGELTCDKAWTRGFVVTVTCTIHRTSYPSKCTYNTNITDFRREDGVAFVTSCRVPDFTCSFPEPVPGGCACVSSSPNYVFKYTFIADENYSGRWGCFTGCFIGASPALTIPPDSESSRLGQSGTGRPTPTLISSEHRPPSSICPLRQRGTRPNLSQAKDPAGYKNVENTNTYASLSSISTFARCTHAPSFDEDSVKQQYKKQLQHSSTNND
ncbi:hypothetical protein BaRGS_00011326 [Batillaria attramentaria]|uniref:Uncharacterized protein n=1 Tax=Batillaria attramentaria TaxID=370345 RepID=A0ABD0LEN8_9CAEN